MVQFTLPTSRSISQSWNMDFKTLNGVYYPNGFYASIGWKGHNGIDYRCPLNDNVEAVCDGIIEYVGPANNHPLLTGGGNAVLLRNDELGIRFEYLHLNQQNVYTGQRVTRGQVIAQSGNTGISSGAHLHLGAIPVRPNLNNGYRGRVDPTPYLYGSSNPDYAGTGIAAAGTTVTPQPAPAPEEIDMAAEERLMAQLNQMVTWEDERYKDLKGKVEGALDHAARAREIAEATEDRGDSAKIALLVQMVTGLDSSFRFIKINGGDESLYEVSGGVARGISLAEWTAKGGLEPRYVDQWVLDGLTPKA